MTIATSFQEVIEKASTLADLESSLENATATAVVWKGRIVTSSKYNGEVQLKNISEKVRELTQTLEEKPPLVAVIKHWYKTTEEQVEKMGYREQFDDWKSYGHGGLFDEHGPKCYWLTCEEEEEALFAAMFAFTFFKALLRSSEAS